MEIKQKTNYQYLFLPKQHNRKDNFIDIVLMKLLDYSFNEIVRIYSLYFVCYYLFGVRFFFKKKLVIWYWVYKSKDSIGKINNSSKIHRKRPYIIISHSWEFNVKPNIGIFTFLGIQIAKHHTPSNLNAKSNVDSPIPNAKRSM